MENNNKMNDEYLESLLSGSNGEQVTKKQKVTKSTENTFELVNDNVTPPSMDYSYIDITKLPAYKFYKPGTKIAIRAAKVNEIQAYSVVDDKNFVDITEKMNE